MARRLVIATLDQSRHVQMTAATGRVLIGTHGQIETEFGATRDQSDSLTSKFSPGSLCDVSWTPREPNNKVLIANTDRSDFVVNGSSVPQGASVATSLPMIFKVADTTVHLFWEDVEHPLSSSLTLLPQQSEIDEDNSLPEGSSPGAATLSSWLKAIGNLQRSVAGSQEFFLQAAKAIRDPGGLDGGLILLATGQGWTTAGSHLPNPKHGLGYQTDLIEQAVAAKTTIFHDTRKIDLEQRDSGTHSAVVSPVFDNDGKPIAAIYGYRSHNDSNSRRGIRRLEAQFVQVVSDSISAAMTRMEADVCAAKSRALLDQTFSPTVARNLENDPSFLDGRSTEVTVMFTDLRGFSTISEQVGPKITYELLADVMDCFSALVSDHDGVVIDFFGDGLSAFWNAPIQQPEHPLFACQCAREMLDSMVELNQRWESRLGRKLEAGIGIHTGIAQVGNSGSRTRLKYGPQGNTVNLASRIEGMTKKVGCPIVISASTAERVSAAMETRRICNVQLKGIQKPVDLYQLLPAGHEQVGSDYFDVFQEASNAFDEHDYERTVQLLTNLQVAHGVEDDPVARFILEQATSFRQDGADHSAAGFSIDFQKNASANPS